MRRRLALAAPLFAGFLSLGGGAALLATILFKVSLVQSLSVALVVVAAGAVVLAAKSRVEVRRHVGRGVVAGLIAGVIATAAYDVSKGILSVADPSPFNPFEAVRVFGILLVGASAPVPLIWAAGIAFHEFNGLAFAIAYSQFFGGIASRSVRWAIGLGMLWGLFLELFQLTLYPGWLSIQFIAEFQTISFSAHLIYGATLGLIVYRRLWRTPPASGVSASIGSGSGPS